MAYNPAQNNASSADVIVLAAGKGTRLKSQLPKVLHSLMRLPLLEHVLRGVESSGINLGQRCVVVGHQAHVVKEFLADRSGEAWSPVLQEPQCGTGHALQEVAKAVTLGDCVLLLSGDVPLLRAETLALLKQTFDEQRANNNVAMVVVGATVENPTGYGRLLQSSDGQLQAIVEEKDATDEQRSIPLVNAGIYALHWPTVAPWLSQLSNNNAQNEVYVTDLVAIARQHQQSVGVFTLSDATEMLGVNSRGDLAECHRLLNERTTHHWMAQGVTLIDPATTWISPEVLHIGADTVIEPNCQLLGSISIGENCTIGANTQLVGAVSIGNHTSVRASVIQDSTIGDHCTIGPFAHIRHQTVVADDVRVGNFVEVKNSTIGDSTNAAHLSYLGDSDIGSHVNMGAGSIVANYDPIRKTKHRTSIDDHVKVGCNSVLVAPVLIGKNACVAAGSVITETVAPDALAIARPRQTTILGWVSKTLSSLLVK
jgi:bifunctional UDP-N-acetylglucosamine pyrophosphorylase/glucosamine-1-phosphate N-acetyltransferase